MPCQLRDYNFNAVNRCDWQYEAGCSHGAYCRYLYLPVTMCQLHCGCICADSGREAGVVGERHFGGHSCIWSCCRRSGTIDVRCHPLRRVGWPCHSVTRPMKCGVRGFVASGCIQPCIAGVDRKCAATGCAGAIFENFVRRTG